MDRCRRRTWGITRGSGEYSGEQGTPIPSKIPQTIWNPGVLLRARITPEAEFPAITPDSCSLSLTWHVMRRY